VMLSPGQILSGTARISQASSARCCLWSAWPSVLLCFALLFFVFNPPLWVHCSTSSSLDSCCLISLDSTISVHGFSHSNSMLVRFLFRLCRFTFCNCAWSSLFSVIMNAQGVAICPPLNGASMLHRFVSSVTSWMRPSSTMAVKWIPNPF